MGKTQGQVCQPEATSRQGDDGEITLLSEQGVENIDGFEQQAAAEADTEQLFGSPEEHQAIINIINHLRKTNSGQQHSAEKLEDLAIDLYNRVCQGIRHGQMSAAQIAQAAEIFGQDPEELTALINS